MLSPAALAVRHRGTCAVALLVATVAALMGAVRLEFDDDYRSVFRSDSPEYRLLEEMTAEFGREENDLFLLMRSEHVLRPNGLRRLFRLHKDLEETGGVASVYSIASLPRLAIPLRREASDDELRRAASDASVLRMLEGRLVAADRSVALVVASLGDRAMPLTEIEPVLARVRDVARRHGVLVTGIPAVRSAVIRAVQRDQTIFNLTAVLLAGGVGLLLFRRWVALLLVGIGPLVGVAWTLGVMGWAGERVNILNSLVPQLVLAIGFTDAVHLLLHFRRRRSEGTPGPEAALDTLRSVGLACFLTSLTTTIGFGSLWLARVELVRRFGVACAAGTLLSFGAVVMVVPLLCSTRLGDRILPADGPARRQRLEQRLTRLTRPAITRPVAVSTAAIVAFLGLGWLSTSVRPDYRYTENLPEDSGAAEVIALREEAFGGSVPLLVRVEWEGDRGPGSAAVQRAIRQVEDALAAEPLVSSVTSYRHLVAAAGGDAGATDAVLSRMPPDLVRRWLTDDRRTALVVALVPDTGSAELLPRIRQMEDRIAALPAMRDGISAQVGGLTALAASSSVLMIGDLARSLGFAALVIFGTMIVAFRSLPLALVSLVPNLLPLVAVTGLLALLDKPLQYTSVAVLTIGLGLAVDDTIHFLVAFRRHGGRARCAAAAGDTIRTAGTALVTTTALLVTGLATLAFSALPTIRLFGLLMCALLGSALVADLYALPALLLACGSRTPAPSDRRTDTPS